MSQTYVMRPPQDTSAISNGSFIGGIDFGVDESGEYGVISFRIPVTVLKKLVVKPGRFLSITATEIRMLLKAILKNDAESGEVRATASKILSAGSR